MKYGPLVFLAAFFALAASWCGFVFAPQIQIGGQTQETNIVATAEMYPQQRPGMAHQGLEVYRQEGCEYCHSQQVGQTGVAVDLALNDAGSNATAVANALAGASGGMTNVDLAALTNGLPKTILRDVGMNVATALIRQLKTAGAKAATRIRPTGPDITRGWGNRRSVAADYIYDYPVMLGSQRVGPDLANVGVRLPDANWQLIHLYAPRAGVKDSPMPPFPFLFEKQKIGREPSPDALQLPKEFAPPAGYEVVPTAKAKALVAYLLSLRAETPVFEAPVTPPPVSVAKTNAPAK